MADPRAGQRDEIDTRFLLANERTLLAWVRTALALLAAAGAVEQFAEISGRRFIAILLALVGIGAAVAGAWRFRRTVVRLQQGQDPVVGWTPPTLAVAVAVIGVVLLVAILAA